MWDDEAACRGRRAPLTPLRALLRDPDGPAWRPSAIEQVTRTRDLLAGHLREIATTLRDGRVPDVAEWADRAARLERELDRMRAAEERARRANPRARRWQGRAAGIRAESRAVDRVAVLVDDLVSLVVEVQPHRRGVDPVDAGTGRVLAVALDALVPRQPA